MDDVVTTKESKYLRTSELDSSAFNDSRSRQTNENVLYSGILTNHNTNSYDTVCTYLYTLILFFYHYSSIYKSRYLPNQNLRLALFVIGSHRGWQYNCTIKTIETDQLEFIFQCDPKVIDSCFFAQVFIY